MNEHVDYLSPPGYASCSTSSRQLWATPKRRSLGSDVLLTPQATSMEDYTMVPLDSEACVRAPSKRQIHHARRSGDNKGAPPIPLSAEFDGLPLLLKADNNWSTPDRTHRQEEHFQNPILSFRPNPYFFGQPSMTDYLQSSHSPINASMNCDSLHAQAPSSGTTGTYHDSLSSSSGSDRIRTNEELRDDRDELPHLNVDASPIRSSTLKLRPRLKRRRISFI